MCGQYRLSFDLLDANGRVIFTGSAGTIGRVSLDLAQRVYEQSCVKLGIEPETGVRVQSPTLAGLG